MEKYLEMALSFLVILPIVTIIHELGHIISVKMFGGKISSITFGDGKELLKIGIIEIKRLYFLGGKITHKKLENDRKYKRILIILSGPLLNLFTYILFLVVSRYWGRSFILSRLITFSLLFCVSNLIPFSFGKTNTDGKQILDLILYGKSVYYKKEKIKRDKA
jgi:Zn-dependent protease